MYPTLRKVLWGFSLFIAGACLLLSFLALGKSILPSFLITPLTWFCCSESSKDLNTALANIARILGTGAALTLLATAADRDIGKVTARDALRAQYPWLKMSYAAFFIMVFLASFAGDCNLTDVAVFSTIGAAILSVWFFWLSLILLLDTKGQLNMAFSYYQDTVAKHETHADKHVFYLLEAVRLTRRAPLSWPDLLRVFRAAIALVSDEDESSKSAAATDRWEESNTLKGIEMTAAAWSELWRDDSAGHGFSALQADMICRNILTDYSLRQAAGIRAILLAGLVSFWFPWKGKRTYVGALSDLKRFCNALRAENKGDDWAEQIISELVCAFGMAMAVTGVSWDKLPWVDTNDLDTAWRQLADEFSPAVFFAIDNSDKDHQDAISNLLECMEWLSRKRLDISWSEYGTDRQAFLLGGKPCSDAMAAEILTNTKLLDTITSKYIKRPGGRHT